MACLILIFGGCFLSWMALAIRWHSNSGLKEANARIDIESLTGCVFFLSQLVPAIRNGSLLPPVQGHAALTFFFALAAVFCVSMEQRRRRARNRVLQEWMSGTLARGLAAGI